ncbi:MAG: hypothetical protein ACJ8AI_06595 [Rhodopila sp.]|jgi:hypothetical protein
MSSFVVESFTPIAKNSLIGFATMRAPSGLVFHDVGVHRKNDSVWASPASKPMVDRNGAVMKDGEGRVRYTPIVSFSDKTVRTRWSNAVVAALKEQRPEVMA